jgi:hypothetical protein
LSPSRVGAAGERHRRRRLGPATYRNAEPELAGNALIADVLISAFVEGFDGLLTRNSAGFRALFPNLIESP